MYYRSPSPYGRYSRSVSRSVSRSRSISRSRSRSRESSVENPGNNLYVTGLSARVTKRDLEKHFLAEGKVDDVHLVVDPWTRESRGFGFVTMSTVEEANRCVKYLSRSVLEGRVIMVEKGSSVVARRRRGRTPTPGRYLGLRTIHCDVDLPVTLPIIGAVLRDTRLSEIEADLTLLTTTGGDLTRLTMTATAGGLTHDLAPLSAGHRRLLLQETPPSICLSEHFTKGEEELFKQCVTWAKEEKFTEELLAQCFTKAQEEKLLSEHFPRTKEELKEEYFSGQLLEESEWGPRSRSVSRSVTPRSASPSA
ncbi:unnamed protein product [Camellia sinensis]